jgi:hypothetical protein
MGIDDPKLKENLGKARICGGIREAIKTEFVKMRSKAIFSKPKGNEKNSNNVNSNRALFDNKTFDNLGIPYEVSDEEKEGFEPGE